MSDPNTTPFAGRPRPVLVMAALLAAIDALAGAGSLLDFLPKTTIGVIVLINVVVGAAGAVLVQGVVTPLSAPQNANGIDLVPATANASAVRAAARGGALQGAREAASGATVQE